MTFRGHDITLGGHVSTAGGVWNAPLRAEKFGFTTFQIFSKNQMQWSAKPLPEDDVRLFRENVAVKGMSKILVHASYLLNLAADDSMQRERTLNAFREEIERSDKLGTEYLVIHPGSAGKIGERKAIRNISDALNSCMTADRKTTVLLETAAGQGTNVGYTFEQLSDMIDGVELKAKVGICFDTCHVFASGYDIKSNEGYAETMDRLISSVGLTRLMAIHLNDSKKGQGSRLDRHEQIGKGMLGLQGIANFVNDRRLSQVPMCLETPLGEEGYDKDIEAIVSVLKG
ncbi:MAG: deoxyribonuclease IV [Candidatus Thermoplasmatota archaeon]|nr:deoxyribonuclease IV [Candidatus Thermoplasmatota archaeon]MCL5730595.1 deoxyribonuclease IV [Candidatus Thermoplasmatota archaeon]